MKRSGAQMRKRCSTNDSLTGKRSHGSLVQGEIDAVRRAYADGSRGEVLIGLRGEERIITMLLPPRPDEHSYQNQVAESMERLRRMGCDGHIYIRRVRRAGSPRGADTVVMVEQCMYGRLKAVHIDSMPST